MDQPPQSQPNLLTSLEWRECQEMPVRFKNAQAVVLGNKVYIGGGSMQRSLPSRLLIYNFTEDSWDIIDTPTEWYALTTYHSQLVLVGGRDQKTKEVTNQLWVLDEQYHWTQPLPPMTKGCSNASAVNVGDHLIVAGGQDDIDVHPLDKVEVYDGHRWRKVESLPKACWWMTSTLHDGYWYLAGGKGQGSEVYQTSLESLIATSEVTGQTSAWKKLPEAPLQLSATATLRDQLITVGGGKPISSAIHAYSLSTNSWVHVGDLPVACFSTCTVVLPTGELLVVGGEAENGLLSFPFRGAIQIGNPAWHLFNRTPFPSSSASLMSKSKKEELELELDLSSIEKKEQQTKPDFRNMAVQTTYDCQEMASYGCHEVAVQTSHGCQKEVSIQTDNGSKKEVAVQTSHGCQKEVAIQTDNGDYWRRTDVIAEASVPVTNKVKLEGAKDHSNFLRIVLAYDGTSVEYGQIPTPDMKDLMKALYNRVAAKWEDIGIYLGLQIATLNTIAAEHPSNPRKCLIEMLKVWLERVDPSPTWSAIIEAVEFLGEEQLGRELKKKYCS